MSQMNPWQKLYKGVEVACCNFLSIDHLKRVRSPQEPSRVPEEAAGAFSSQIDRLAMMRWLIPCAVVASP